MRILSHAVRSRRKVWQSTHLGIANDLLSLILALKGSHRVVLQDRDHFINRRHSSDASCSEEKVRLRLRVRVERVPERVRDPRRAREIPSIEGSNTHCIEDGQDVDVGAETQLARIGQDRHPAQQGRESVLQYTDEADTLVLVMCHLL